MYGRRVHEAVLASGVGETGATVHLVDEEYDRGAILAQARVPVLPGDTPETLAARVLAEEHRLLPAVVLAAARAGRPVPLRRTPGVCPRDKACVPRALISVSDKRGIVPFAQGLVDLGWDMISTGGTAATLRAAGVPVTPVDQVTGFPEMLDGRVKTLHPAIHAGLLARRDIPNTARRCAGTGSPPIDLVAVNLYPFRETVAKPHVTFEDAIENIDVGGPSMLRSAAKNHESVIVVVDPTDYTRVLELLRAGGVPRVVRQELAAKVFSHTADYDGAIARYLTPSEDGLPHRIELVVRAAHELRYGENPSQRAGAVCRRGAARHPRPQAAPGQGTLLQQHARSRRRDVGGLAVDQPSRLLHRQAHHALRHRRRLDRRGGVSQGAATDPQSAFGGVVAFNTVVDLRDAEALVDASSRWWWRPRSTTRRWVLCCTRRTSASSSCRWAAGQPGLDFKRVRGGFLVQDRFVARPLRRASGPTPTARQPTEPELVDLRFAWAAVAAVKSNAVLLARDEMTIGIGAGQMSRVDSSFLAVHKARQQRHDPRGSVMASDAFFPFADGVEEAAAAGVTAIIQPGGSVRDAEVIAAADKHGMAMVLTGKRQFRH